MCYMRVCPAVLQFVPSHVDVRLCSFSERVEKGLLMAYAEARKRSQENGTFTLHVRMPLGDTFKIKDETLLMLYAHYIYLFTSPMRCSSAKVL